MNIAIIYHDADFDGKLSNDVCRYWLKKLNPDAVIHCYGWDYGRPIPIPLHKWWDDQTGEQFSNEWSLYDQIYIVDLSVDDLMARPELRSKIVWIDHHKSAIEKWDDEAFHGSERLGGYRIDGVAACRLCWQWFQSINEGYGLPRKDTYVARYVHEPSLLRLAGEYDVWDLRDPDAKALQFGLRALDDHKLVELVQSQFIFEGNTLLLNTIKSGRAIKFYCDKQNDEYASLYSHTIQWEGLSFCCLNIGQRGNSDPLRASIKPEHDACMAWRYDGKQAYVSLYGIEGKDIDLSIIATKHGGGGHRGACGFRCGLRKMADIIGES